MIATSVNRTRRLGVVDRPHAAARRPVQHAQRLPVAFAPHTTIALEQVFEFAATHDGEALAQARLADLRTQLVEEADHFVARRAIGALSRPAQWAGGGDAIQQVTAPPPERATGDPKPVGDVGPQPAKVEQMTSHFGGAAANLIFALSLRLLIDSAAPLRRRRAIAAGCGRLRALVDEIPERGRFDGHRISRRVRGYGFFPASPRTRGRLVAISERIVAACNCASSSATRSCNSAIRSSSVALRGRPADFNSNAVTAP